MKKKILAAALVVMLLCGCVAGTLAYLSDNSTVTNTFTVGDVDIKLTEAAVDKNGKATEERTEEGNEYKLYPGMSYDKDPTVTVIAESESSYIRMLVTVSPISGLKTAIPVADHPEFYNGDLFLLQMLVGGWDKDKWVYKGFDAATGTYEFRYFQTVDTLDADDKDLEPLFTTVEIPGFVDNAGLEALSGVTVSIEADAIQSVGFADADAAWAAFDD